MSRLDLLAGPNGAGKSTFFEQIIRPARPGLPFVNADLIAAERWPGQEVERAYDAARLAADTRDALIQARLDFCTETVFSHPSKVDLVTSAVAAGYDVILHVLLVPLALCGPRVQRRVLGGGHAVPEDKLASRYERIWPLVVQAVPHCTLARFWDNARDDGPFEVASFRRGIPDHPPRWPDWVPDALARLTG